MTDNDIIKALGCCSKSSKIGDCIDNKCTLLGEYGCSGWMDNKLIKSALDLINRQKAENERLKEEISVRDKIIDERGAEVIRHDNAIRSLHKQLETLKAEAITELETKLTMHFGTYTDKDYLRVIDMLRLIKQIAEEMKEGVNNA